jgi:hypothetical protein
MNEIEVEVVEVVELHSLCFEEGSCCYNLVEEEVVVDVNL